MARKRIFLLSYPPRYKKRWKLGEDIVIRENLPEIERIRKINEGRRKRILN
jgi:hypothetical protein